MTTTRPDDILQFWLGSTNLSAVVPLATQARWFNADPAFDAEIEARFGTLFETPEAVESWATDPAGALAAIIVFDQFPRNVFRGRARAFATDARALRLATATVAARFDQEMGMSQRAFVYLPFEHAEDIASQDRSVGLFTALVNDTVGGVSSSEGAVYLTFAEAHRATIARFGRFPGRNAAMGRTDTPEEEAYLSEGGDTWGQSKKQG